MTGASWRKTLLYCLLGIFATILISIVVEAIAIRREIGEMTVLTRVAAGEAMSRFSNLEFAVDDFKDLAYSGDAFDMKVPENYSGYDSYLNSLTAQAKQAGIYTDDSDIKVILQQLRDSVDNYRKGRTNYCYTPMQFGYSYLDASYLRQIFAENVSSMVNSNYHQNREENLNLFTLAFVGNDRVLYDGVEVTISEPKLLLNRGEEGKSFASLFGSSRSSIMDMTGEHENALKEYDYVIAFDVLFHVKWKHQTIMPFFRNWAFIQDRIDESLLNPVNGQLRINMNDIEYGRRFILTN